MCHEPEDTDDSPDEIDNDGWTLIQQYGDDWDRIDEPESE